MCRSSLPDLNFKFRSISVAALPDSLYVGHSFWALAPEHPEFGHIIEKWLVQALTLIKSINQNKRALDV